MFEKKPDYIEKKVEKLSSCAIYSLIYRKYKTYSYSVIFGNSNSSSRAHLLNQYTSKWNKIDKANESGKTTFSPISNFITKFRLNETPSTLYSLEEIRNKHVENTECAKMRSLSLVKSTKLTFVPPKDNVLSLVPPLWKGQSVTLLFFNQ